MGQTSFILRTARIFNTCVLVLGVEKPNKIKGTYFIHSFVRSFARLFIYLFIYLFFREFR